MPALPPCPKCNSTLTYEDVPLLVCPECAHEWSPQALSAETQSSIIRDANGNVLQDGDTMTVIKDLKIKG